MEKPQETQPGDLDTSAAGRGVWLVKVPKYLSEKWQKTSGDVGKLRISKPRFQGGKPEVVFTLNEQLAVKEPTEKASVPRDHKFVLTGLSNQTLAVLTRCPAETGACADPPIHPPENVAVEGKVIQRAECRPVADAGYMQLKRTHLELHNKPQRVVVKLDRAVTNFKPVKDHIFNVQHEQKKREEGKRARDDKDKVMDMLFSAFEKHQYYNVKDLVRLTKQPVTYLKEILKEICVYNMKAPHKNMWELKPEYRHYKEPKS